MRKMLYYGFLSIFFSSMRRHIFWKNIEDLYSEFSKYQLKLYIFLLLLLFISLFNHGFINKGIEILLNGKVFKDSKELFYI